MTPARPLARAIAGALLDGDWQAGAMRVRLAGAFGEERLWMRSLVRHAVRAFAAAPLDAPRSLARWVSTRRVFAIALRDRLTVRRWSLPVERMAKQVWPVPAIDTLGDLAAWLDLELPALEALADRRGLSSNAGPRARHYRYRWVPKRSGGFRLIEAPKLRLRTIQRLILDRIIAHIPPHDAVYGFRSGRAVPDFARMHVGQAVVIRADLRSFFTSVSAGRVLGIFRTAGYPERVARTLAALCTHATPRDMLLPELDFDERRRLLEAHLPQGAPTSGALANLAAYRLDLRVAGLARAAGLTYARYADDLVLSGARAGSSLIAHLGAIAAEEGFGLNFRKTRVMRSAQRQRVTGVVVNTKLSPARSEYDRLRAILHNCARTGPAQQNRDGLPNFRAYLLGRIAWMAQLDPTKGARLRAAFERIAWTESVVV